MKKKNDLVWSISFFVMLITGFIAAGSIIIGIELPDVGIRILGIVDLIALPFWAFTTVKKLINIDINFQTVRLLRKMIFNAVD